jgi:hypothetical protein
VPSLASVLAAAVVATLALLGFGSSWVWQHTSVARKVAVRKWWEVLGLDTKLKLLVGFYLIMTKIGYIYCVSMPSEVQSILNAFEVAVSLGLGIKAPFECIGAHHYEQRLVIWILLPLVLVGSLFAVGYMRNCLWPHASRHWALANVCRLMFLLYTLVNAKAFEAFPCHDFGAQGRWLVADVSVQCDSTEHARIRTFAWIAIGIYPGAIHHHLVPNDHCVPLLIHVYLPPLPTVGWTIATATLLYLARKPILGHVKPTVLSRALYFVYGEYSTDFFWWELMEMFRRFLLVGLLSTVYPCSIVQLVVATVLCVLYLIIQLLASPY